MCQSEDAKTVFQHQMVTLTKENFTGYEKELRAHKIPFLYVLPKLEEWFQSHGHPGDQVTLLNSHFSYMFILCFLGNTFNFH